MSTMLNEYDFITDIVMPFLRHRWDDIDQPEKLTRRSDGRLTRDELEKAYNTARNDGRQMEARILFEILMRYEVICKAYDDGYWEEEETILGISEEDLSVYQQIHHPEFRRRNGSPKPALWF